MVDTIFIIYIQSKILPERTNGSKDRNFATVLRISIKESLVVVAARLTL